MSKEENYNKIYGILKKNLFGKDDISDIKIKSVYKGLENEKEEEEREIRNQERKDVLGMRKVWSIWLLRLIWLIALFDMVIVLGYGFKWLTFENENFVAIIIGENLLKIAGLAFIVVKFLFDGKSTK